jgi:hypothetical protein
LAHKAIVSVIAVCISKEQMTGISHPISLRISVSSVPSGSSYPSAAMEPYNAGQTPPKGKAALIPPTIMDTIFFKRFFFIRHPF